MTILDSLIATVAGPRKPRIKRSPQWRAARRMHLRTHGACAACGGTEKLEVHHILPVHLFRALELHPDNLITLCESGPGDSSCHCFFGHCGNWRAYNPTVRTDCVFVRTMLFHRVLPEGDQT